MSALRRAELHLAKARQFLEAAESNNSDELYDAATSNAVTSGINSKDAICLSTTGVTKKSDNHSAAVNELKAASKDAAAVAPAFKRLLSAKTKAQYHESATPRARAASAVKWAQKMLDAATRIVVQ